ncbi:MAG: esterase-like activity of phytase family protein [Acidobacteriota bacterium]
MPRSTLSSPAVSRAYVSSSPIPRLPAKAEPSFDPSTGDAPSSWWISTLAPLWAGCLALGMTLGLLGCASTPSPATSADAAAQTSTATAKAAEPALGAAPDAWEFLGQGIAPKRAPDGSPVGGLSGLVYNASEDLWWAVSDDASRRAPARLHPLRIDLSEGRLQDQSIELLPTVFLQHADGSVFAEDSLDPEALVQLPDGGFFVASEGMIDEGVAPWIRRFDADAKTQFELPLPQYLLPQDRQDGRGGKAGPRHNMVFESLALSPSGRWLFTATENALTQDGPQASPDAGSPVRILRYSLHSSRPADQAPALDGEYLYVTEKVPHAALAEGDLAINGLVDLLALSDTDLLALERGYTKGVGNTAKIFHVDLASAPPLFAGGEPQRPVISADPQRQPVQKTLVLDLETLRLDGEPLLLDNVEALALGPRLEDGRRTLVLASDDNFSDTQINQFLLFALSPRPSSAAEIQGAAHRSPFATGWSEGHVEHVVEAVITAVDRPDEVDEEGDAVGPRAFWIQDSQGDGNPHSSDALYVTPHPRAAQPKLAPGQQVRVIGFARELADRGGLPVTTLEEAIVEVTRDSVPLPAPVQIGSAGRQPPAGAVDDDALGSFEPDSDSLDFFESLEGMRVAVQEPLVVGPTTEYGGLVVIADGGRDSQPRSDAGGVVLVDGDLNAERVLVDRRLVDELPDAAVGDRFASPLTGILGYAYGAYQLFVTEDFPALESASADAPPPALAERWAATEDYLTIASYNVLNLDLKDSDNQYLTIARHVVDSMRSPDAIALQEIQDDSGPRERGETETDGVVSSAKTLERLIERIVSVGGPRYEAHWVDPDHDADGGQPGGNIRVAYLTRPDRVEVPVRTLPGGVAAGPNTPVQLGNSPSGHFLTPNPARVDPTAESFYRVRKSLALEVHFQGQRVFLINNHLKSKGGDDRIYGSPQPPVPRTEAPRLESALVLRTVVDSILAANPAAHIVLLGDLNEHEFRAPLRALTEVGKEGEPGLVNLIEGIPTADRYTYNWRGNSQILDHILVSPSLADRAEIRILHVNTDVPASRAGSDHDPVITRLHLPAATH